MFLGVGCFSTWGWIGEEVQEKFFRSRNANFVPLASLTCNVCLLHSPLSLLTPGECSVGGYLDVCFGAGASCLKVSLVEEFNWEGGEGEAACACAWVRSAVTHLGSTSTSEGQPALHVIKFFAAFQLWFNWSSSTDLKLTLVSYLYAPMSSAKSRLLFLSRLMI